jgi:hypothetical protein
MDTFIIVIWITAVINVATLICFFVLCSNVFSIKKKIRNQEATS